MSALIFWSIPSLSCHLLRSQNCNPQLTACRPFSYDSFEVRLELCHYEASVWTLQERHLLTVLLLLRHNITLGTGSVENRASHNYTTVSHVYVAAFVAVNKALRNNERV